MSVVGYIGLTCSFMFLPLVVLGGLRKHEDGWVFEDPVTEAIAPGYFDVVQTPMDYSTVEKNLDSGKYKTQEEVGVASGCGLKPRNLEAYSESVTKGLGESISSCTSM